MVTKSAPAQTKPASDGPSITTLVVFCGFLTTLSGFSTDIMLPAFDRMALELESSMELVQATLSTFALSFGLSQIVYGPASDRFGRRPVIAVGLIIFLMGSALTIVGNSIEIVLAGRALQGFGASAAPVLGRAILRDIHSGTALARAMATAAGIFALGPIIAPMLGYSVMGVFGWRAIFVCMGVLALVLLLFDLLRYRETNQNLDPNAIDPAAIKRSLGVILRNHQSRYFIACACVAFCALFNYIANAPLIYKAAFGVAGFDFALLFGLTGIGIVVGQIVNRTLLPRLGILTMLRIASLILFLASCSTGLLTLLGGMNEFTFTAAMFFFNTSFLVVISNSTTLAMDPHPKLAGLTSALFGFSCNWCGAVFITVTVGMISADIVVWSLIMAVMTGLSMLGIWTVNRNKLDFTHN